MLPAYSIYTHLTQIVVKLNKDDREILGETC